MDREMPPPLHVSISRHRYGYGWTVSYTSDDAATVLRIIAEIDTQLRTSYGEAPFSEERKP